MLYTDIFIGPLIYLSPSILINQLFFMIFSDEQDAEDRCHQALKEAFKEDKDNIEAHQSMANLRLVRNNT